jgi:hypothetical protein
MLCARESRALIECNILRHPMAGGAMRGCALAEGLLRIFIAIAPANIPYLSHVQLDFRIAAVTIFAGTASDVPAKCVRPRRW